MNSIFNSADCQQINQRIDSLSPDSKANWGKMNVSQMLAHCQAPLNVGLGTHTLGKYNFILQLVGKMAKKSLVKDEKPFKYNQPTDKTFVVADPRDFETEKEKLKDSVNKFSLAGKEGRLIGKHPFFGTLSQDEWDKLQWKHLDHHLRQFGA